MKWLRYYHTLRHVPIQRSLQRVWFKWHWPKPDLRPAPSLRSPSAARWIRMPLRRPVMLSPTRFRLLNEEFEVETEEDWSSARRKFLWNLNLHYFEDLVAEKAERRRAWHRTLIEKWISQNPPGPEIGWEPYPMSLRICNWIKWALASQELSPQALHSLAVQTRYLCKRYDRHLLGNHLLVNAKAFIFAGLFFDGAEATKWYQKGMTILRQQVPEQILPDGGHFERSPMYHNLITEDFLDLLNILRVYGRDGDYNWHEELARMLHWAQALCHPDGQIALLNDAAFEIAPTAAQLLEYAEKLDLSPVRFDGGDAVLQTSGYIRACRGPAVLFADVGPVGPDYLPGHGHADTLSFELSLHGRRVIVDSGTSIYQMGTERLRQRGTGAHNTLQIDGEDSSEVWASFRVARRARVTSVKIDPSSDLPDCRATASPFFRLSAAHNGYRRLRGIGDHRRTLVLHQDQLEIEDEIEGSGEHEIRIAFHLHPQWGASAAPDGRFELALREPISGDQGSLRIELDSKFSHVISSTSYHPEFGLSIPNQKILGVYRGNLPVKFATHLSWS